MNLKPHNLKSPLRQDPGAGPAIQAGGQSQPWWDKERHAARRPLLLARNAAVAQTRAFFSERGFVEVETPALQVSPGNETHLHALQVATHHVDGSIRKNLMLHTSPEFALKKLLSAGERKIFSLARCYRDREEGPLHATEFTMLEWYQTDGQLEDLMEHCVSLIRDLAETLHTDHLRYRTQSLSVHEAPRILTVAEALNLYADIVLDDVLDDKGEWRVDALRQAAKKSGLRVAPDDRGGDIFSRLLTEKIEPFLGKDGLTFLTRYPLAEAALARVCPGDPRLAERFELYACGIELANAFGELNDPLQQRQRFEKAMEEKERIYGERYPIDEDFLLALETMPAAAGIAVGFDRLMMLLTGTSHIRDVIWAPGP